MIEWLIQNMSNWKPPYTLFNATISLIITLIIELGCVGGLYVLHDDFRKKALNYVFHIYAVIVIGNLLSWLVGWATFGV